MVPGSPRLRSLNAAPEDVNRILTWAEETEADLVYRVLGGAAETLLSDPFTANRDIGVGIANNVTTTSRDREAVWRTRAGNSGPLGDWFSGRYYSRKEMRDLRDAYADANRVLRNMDREYKTLARFTVFENTGPGTPARCTCIEEGFEDGSEFYREYVIPNITSEAACNAKAGPGGCTYVTWRPARPTTPEAVYTPNDGIVPVASQRAFTQRFQIPMPGDNHFTSNNSPLFRTALNTILNGDSNPWFDSRP